MGGSVVPYDGHIHLTSVKSGEPIESLGFTALPYDTGSYQDKTIFDTYDQAWQGCAKQCNWDPRCHTYTVSIRVMNCYTNTVLSDDQEYTSYHVSGVCRTNEK